MRREEVKSQRLEAQVRSSWRERRGQGREATRERAPILCSKCSYRSQECKLCYLSFYKALDI